MWSLAKPEPFHLYDTSLRDGAQQEGLRLSVNDKLRIAAALDSVGVSFIEGGWPGANPTDTEFFARAKTQLRLSHAQLTAFGATRRVGLTAATDPATAALLDADTEVICLVAKSHERHVTHALRTTLETNLEMIRDTVSFLCAHSRRVFVDCEHFFDGYLVNPTYAKLVAATAAEAGAEVVVLCDTNGGMLPSQIPAIVDDVAQLGLNLGIHCHNDTGCAVANTLAGVDAGVMHVQGTVNGYGERTGNADLTTLIANLKLKYHWDVVSDEALRDLTHVSHTVAEIANQSASPRQPYVGVSSFAHKAGLHASAIKVDANLYQHIDPAVVGNDMRMLISDMAGRANIQIKAEQLGHDLSDQSVAARLADTVKRREAQGYSYEAADASFDLLVRSELGQDLSAFVIGAWRVFTDRDEASQAVVRVGFADATPKPYVGEGNGPVNALDQALREALTDRHPRLAQVELTDYRVRLLDNGHGTDATTRVLIDTRLDSVTWTTVGVGANVIEASWEALVDAYTYALVVVLASDDGRTTGAVGSGRA
ncbi:MAG: citramalate synthase [Propionibacteriaceae bacterium]|jgi:2-isopropylmalate synthase|nr:citramalate synthase [Propionibacteriaceae bacterium]